MTRKKRVEAWGELLNGRLAAVHCERKVAESWAEGDAPRYGPARVVRLVEYDARKEAVVRAAVRYIDSCTMNISLHNALARAVEKLKGGKR